MIEEKHIENYFENSYFQQHENAVQYDGIKGVCDIEMHLDVPTIEESTKVNLFQISNEYVVLETIDLDSHEGLLLNLFFEKEINIHIDIEDTMLQIDHHRLQERSEKENYVLELFPNDDFPPSSENEDFAEEEEFFMNLMDVHNFSFDNTTTSNAYFQEQNFLSPNII